LRTCGSAEQAIGFPVAYENAQNWSVRLDPQLIGLTG
jgi:hypothetical protein